MTINEKVDEIEQQICCHEISKEQVFTKMKYFIQQLQNTSSNKKYTAPQVSPKSCPRCTSQLIYHGLVDDDYWCSHCHNRWA